MGRGAFSRKRNGRATLFRGASSLALKRNGLVKGLRRGFWNCRRDWGRVGWKFFYHQGGDGLTQGQVFAVGTGMFECQWRCRIGFRSPSVSGRVGTSRSPRSPGWSGRVRIGGGGVCIGGGARSRAGLRALHNGAPGISRGRALYRRPRILNARGDEKKGNKRCE